jgi:sigma-B regulation protein RsbU (phosphoserine phosphatase)
MMFPPDLDPYTIIPLHRLLKKQEISALLKSFSALLPEVQLAVVRLDGQLFVGNGAWPADQIAALLSRSSEGTAIPTRDFIVRPLCIRTGCVGGLVVRGPDGEVPPETELVLQAFQQSLTLLLEQSLETRDLARETLERYREINLLYQISETIGASLDPEEIPQLVLHEASRVILAQAGVVVVPQNGEGLWTIKAKFGDPGYADALFNVSGHIIEQAHRQGRPAIVTPPALSPAVGRIGSTVTAVLCTPLKTQEQVIGVILLGRWESRGIFTAGDEKLLTALAAQAAIAIETARLHQEELKQQRLEEELAIGRQIQLSLLPQAYPVIAGWEFAAVYEPSRLVGGDLYDFFPLPGSPARLGLVIADVTGKGVPAALFMTFSRTIIRSESQSGRNPAAVLKQANRLMVQENRARLYLTAFYATLNLENGQLAYASAGHNWPLWVQAKTGECLDLEAQGFVLGAMEDIQLEEREVTLAPGDLVVFYTDGVTEARDTSGQIFGEARLRQTLMDGASHASAQQILQTVVQAIDQFTGDTPQSDDFTLMVVKRQQNGKANG